MSGAYRQLAERTRPNVDLAPWSGTLPSVWVEDLTWVEIARGQQSGYDTILIPTGGTEAGGPFLPTGKHNTICRFTADAIARRHGRMLVAPVLSYVPEDPHLGYPGTISVPESVFAQVVEAAANSFLSQGFRHVVLMGDSGANQAPLRAVADRLQRQWDRDQRRIVWLEDYYVGHGQDAWLLAQGLAETQLGSHAGVADTAEFMAIDPQAVRNELSGGSSSALGHDGQPQLASVEMGRRLLELKIDAALRQLHQDLSSPEDATANWATGRPDHLSKAHRAEAR
jgi:creatinine amidohydrolase/Fe(II)-dependent formamide hydrolase-like protein